MTNSMRPGEGAPSGIVGRPEPSRSKPVTCQGRFSVLFLVSIISACAVGGGTPASSPAPVEATPPPPPAELPVELLAGKRVTDIRLLQDPVVLLVGESFSLADLEPIPIDAEGNPVREAPIMWVPPDGPEAALQQGRVVAFREGETELLLAVMAPGSGGGPEPRMFPKRIVVRGAPVASLEVVAPDLALYTGTAIPLRAEPLTGDGLSRLRFETAWSSRNPDIASVSEGGFVRGHRAGTATIVASVEGVEAAHVIEVLENPVSSIELTPGSGAVRTGDVVRFQGLARDAAGGAVTDVAITWAVGGEGIRAGLGAAVYEDGAFVAEEPGVYRVIASAGSVASEAVIEARPRDVAEEPIHIGTGLLSHTTTTDLWVFRGRDGRDYAYTGTHAGGQKMFVWDVTDPANPVVTDSVVVDARVVNDVKVNGDATLAVLTREGASDRRNGIVLLDIEEPAHPRIITTYADNLTGGVHNTFFVGDLLYAVHNGTLDIHIIDLADPASPHEVGRWGIDVPGKYLHDFWVVDGLGYASYWDDGVWILDVGDGRWGGTPVEPVVVSSYAYPEGHTHVAFPYRNSDGHSYLFVGDEIFGCDECISRSGPHERGPRGFVHVISIDDPENPVEVGRYEVPEAGVHNLWVEDDRLYAAYYQAGLRVVDVSGELRGDLYAQGREIAWFPTGHPDGYSPNSPMAWGPQPFGGNVFVSDMHSGLWVVRLQPRPRAPLLP